MKKNTKNEVSGWERATPRGMVLSVLGVITLSVAVLSVAVSYDILEPKFGAWAVPTVAALDALWVVFQATEILAGNNRRRASRVQYAGLALTAVNAAIPTADLILSADGHFDLAVVLTPIAIVATKVAWWIVLPSLGRKVSTATRTAISDKRQTVSDRLEQMEAEAAHRIELLTLATELETQVTQAETAYRLAVLEAQQSMHEELYEQAETTAQTVREKALPSSVAAIRLPGLDRWDPVGLALPGTPGGTQRHTLGTQVTALPSGSVTPSVTPDGTPEDAADTPGGTPREQAARTAALADLAAVAGVPAPEPGEPLTDGQVDVVLRHLRYADDPPLSYRQARDAYRRAGFIGSEERIRTAWTALVAREGHGEMSETTDTEEEPADVDTDA